MSTIQTFEHRGKLVRDAAKAKSKSNIEFLLFLLKNESDPAMKKHIVLCLFQLFEQNSIEMLLKEIYSVVDPGPYFSKNQLLEILQWHLER